MQAFSQDSEGGRPILGAAMPFRQATRGGRLGPTFIEDFQSE